MCALTQRGLIALCCAMLFCLQVPDDSMQTYEYRAYGEENGNENAGKCHEKNRGEKIGGKKSGGNAEIGVGFFFEIYRIKGKKKSGKKIGSECRNWNRKKCLKTYRIRVKNIGGKKSTQISGELSNKIWVLVALSTSSSTCVVHYLYTSAKKTKKKTGINVTKKNRKKKIRKKNRGINREWMPKLVSEKILKNISGKNQKNRRGKSKQIMGNHKINMNTTCIVYF